MERVSRRKCSLLRTETSCPNEPQKAAGSHSGVPRYDGSKGGKDLFLDMKELVQNDQDGPSSENLTRKAKIEVGARGNFSDDGLLLVWQPFKGKQQVWFLFQPT